jgi:hypothetical protein
MEKGFLLAPGFRGFGPWLLGPWLLGPVTLSLVKVGVVGSKQKSKTSHLMAAMKQRKRGKAEA